MAGCQSGKHLNRIGCQIDSHIVRDTVVKMESVTAFQVGIELGNHLFVIPHENRVTKCRSNWVKVVMG